MSAPRHLQESARSDSPPTFRQQSEWAARRKSLGLREGGEGGSDSVSPAREAGDRRRVSSREGSAGSDANLAVGRESAPRGPAAVGAAAASSTGQPIPLRRSSLGHIPPSPPQQPAHDTDTATRSGGGGGSGGARQQQPLYKPEARSVGYPHPLRLRVPVKESPERSSSSARDSPAGKDVNRGSHSPVSPPQRDVLTTPASSATPSRLHDAEVEENSLTTMLSSALPVEGPAAATAAAAPRAEDEKNSRLSSAVPHYTANAEAEDVAREGHEADEPPAPGRPSVPSQGRASRSKSLHSSREGSGVRQEVLPDEVERDEMETESERSPARASRGSSAGSLSVKHTSASPQQPAAPADDPPPSTSFSLAVAEDDDVEEIGEEDMQEIGAGSSQHARPPPPEQQQPQTTAPVDTAGPALHARGPEEPSQERGPSADSSSSASSLKASRSRQAGSLPRGLSISSGTSRQSRSSLSSSTRASHLQHLAPTSTAEDLGSHNHKHRDEEKSSAGREGPAAPPSTVALKDSIDDNDSIRSSRSSQDGAVQREGSLHEAEAGRPVEGEVSEGRAGDVFAAADDGPIRSHRAPFGCSRGNDESAAIKEGNTQGGVAGKRPEQGTTIPAHASERSSISLHCSEDDASRLDQPLPTSAPPPKAAAAVENPARTRPIQHGSSSSSSSGSDAEPLLLAPSRAAPRPQLTASISAADETPSEIFSVAEATPERLHGPSKARPFKRAVENDEGTLMAVSAISPDGAGDEVEVSRLTQATAADSTKKEGSRHERSPQCEDGSPPHAASSPHLASSSAATTTSSSRSSQTQPRASSSAVAAAAACDAEHRVTTPLNASSERAAAVSALDSPSAAVAAIPSTSGNSSTGPNAHDAAASQDDEAARGADSTHDADGVLFHSLRDDADTSLGSQHRPLPYSWRGGSAAGRVEAASPATPPSLPHSQTHRARLHPLTRIPMHASTNSMTDETANTSAQQQSRSRGTAPRTALESSRFLTPYSEETITAPITTAEASRISEHSLSPRREPGADAAMLAQPTDVAAVIHSLFRAEARKHAQAVSEAEESDRAAIEEAYMKEWWAIMVREAAAAGLLPEMSTPRRRQHARAASPTTQYPFTSSRGEDGEGNVRSPRTMSAPEAPPRSASPAGLYASKSSYNFNLPRQWLGGGGGDSRRTSRSLVSPHAHTPLPVTDRDVVLHEESGDLDDSVTSAVLSEAPHRSRTQSPSRSRVWGRRALSTGDVEKMETEAQRGRVSLPVLAAMRSYATESIAANVTALSADEILYRSYLEDMERGDFYLLARLHHCVSDALQPLHLYLLEASSRRAIEAESRRDEGRIREYYSYAAVDQEVSLFRDAVRQRAVLVEMEDKIRRDVIPVEEARERGQLVGLFWIGLGGLVRQAEAFRAGVDAATRAALEELSYGERRAREGVRVQEVRDRALLYESVAAASWRGTRGPVSRDGSSSSTAGRRADGVAKQLCFDNARDVPAREARMEEGEEPDGAGDALPDVEYFLDGSGHLRTRLSSPAAGNLDRKMSDHNGPHSARGRGGTNSNCSVSSTPVDAEQPWFEWNPTSNTNTSRRTNTGERTQDIPPHHPPAHGTGKRPKESRETGSSSSPSPQLLSSATEHTTPREAKESRSSEERRISSEEEGRRSQTVVVDAQAAQAAALKHALAQAEAAQRGGLRDWHLRGGRLSRSSSAAASSLHAPEEDVVSDATETAVGPDEATAAPPQSARPSGRAAPQMSDATPARQELGDGRSPHGSPPRACPPLNRHIVPCSLRPFPHQSYQRLIDRFSPTASPSPPRPPQHSRRPYDERTLYTCSPARLRRLGIGQGHGPVDPAEWSTEEIAGDSPLASGAQAAERDAESASERSDDAAPALSPPRPDPDATNTEAFLLSPRRPVCATNMAPPRASPASTARRLPPAPAQGRGDATTPRSGGRDLSPSGTASVAVGRTPSRERGYLTPTAASLRQQQSTALLRILRQQEASLVDDAHGTPLTATAAARCSRSRRGGRYASDGLQRRNESSPSVSPARIARLPLERGRGVWSSSMAPRDPYGLGPQATHAPPQRSDAPQPARRDGLSGAALHNSVHPVEKANERRGRDGSSSAGRVLEEAFRDAAAAPNVKSNRASTANALDAPRSARSPASPQPPPQPELSDAEDDAAEELTADHFDGYPARVSRGCGGSLGQRRRDAQHHAQQLRLQGHSPPLQTRRAARARETAATPPRPSSYAQSLRGQSREAVERRLGQLAEACATVGPPLRQLMPPSPSLQLRPSVNTSDGGGGTGSSYVELHDAHDFWGEPAAADGLELGRASLSVIRHRQPRQPQSRPRQPDSRLQTTPAPTCGRSGGVFVAGPDGQRSWVYGSPFFAQQRSAGTARF